MSPTDREAFLRCFHAARPGVTSAAFRRSAGLCADGYDRLIAAVPAGARVLDLACGDAYLVSRLGPRAVGLDLAPSHQGARPQLVAGRAQAMPFADGAFDACVCHLAFMLFDALDEVVAELRRVVVPGGVFAAVLGGGPTADDDGEDAFHRFLAIAPLRRSRGFGDPRARTEHGWRALFGAAPAFERFEVDLSGAFDEVWQFLGASYQLADEDAPAVRARLQAMYSPQAPVPCRVVMWLARVSL